MSERQWKRWEAMERIERGALTGREAAELLGICERQVRRLRRAVAQRGRRALVHVTDVPRSIG